MKYVIHTWIHRNGMEICFENSELSRAAAMAAAPPPHAQPPGWYRTIIALSNV